MFCRLWIVLPAAGACLAGCGLSECRTLCAQNADCIEAELAAFDSTWSEWTGFADRAAYEADCLVVFQDSREDAGRRQRLQRTCRDMADAACP